MSLAPTFFIENPNSHGFCASYSEVRRYRTSLANLEIDRIQDMSYVPYGIALFRKGGRIIQEGAENINLNAETIDGKIARVVFQYQNESSNAHMSSIKDKRGIERSLKLNDSNNNLMACLPFDNPTKRYGPPRYSDVNDKIVSCFMENRGIYVLSFDFFRDKTYIQIHFLQKALKTFFHFGPILAKG